MRTFLSGLVLVSACFHTVFADSITQPRVPETIRAGDTTTFGTIVNTDTNGRRIFGALIELMYGPAASLGNDVADIVCEFHIFFANNSLGLKLALVGNSDGFSQAYKFPKSLSAGTYHIRMSCTTNGTSESSPQTLQIRSTDIQITPGQFNCQRPPPWRNVTSTTDASYTAIYITNPNPGDVRRASGDGKLTPWVVGWIWRDERNDFGRGIDNLKLEFVQEDGNGGYKVLKTADNPDVTVTSHLFNLDNVTFTPGAYNIRVTYTNVFPEGTTPAGQTVTYVSDPFFVSAAGSDCAGLEGGPSGGSSGGMGGSSGGNNGSTPGGSNNGDTGSETTGAPSSQSTGAANLLHTPSIAAGVVPVSSILLISYLF
jgi:hypothetical protein